MFGNRVLLKWKEPRFAEKHVFSQLTAKDYFTIFGKFIWKWVFGTFLVFSFLRWISPRSDYSFFDPEMLGVIALIVVCVTFIWLLQVLGKTSSNPEIPLREKDIFVISAEGGFNLKYKDIQSCSIGKINFNEQEFNILEIKHFDGNESFLEIDPKIKYEEVLKVLNGRNVQIKPSLFNPL